MRVARSWTVWRSRGTCAERNFFIHNILVRIHNPLIRIHLTRWTGLAPWEFELSFPGSLASTLLVLTSCEEDAAARCVGYRIEGFVLACSVEDVSVEGGEVVPCVEVTRHLRGRGLRVEG